VPRRCWLYLDGDSLTKFALAHWGTVSSAVDDLRRSGVGVPAERLTDSPVFPRGFPHDLARVWHGRGHLASCAAAVTTALGVRSERAPAAAVGWCDGRTGVLVYVPVRCR
jgi:hypothetical protein